MRYIPILLMLAGCSGPCGIYACMPAAQVRDLVETCKASPSCGHEGGGLNVPPAQMVPYLPAPNTVIILPSGGYDGY